MLRDMVAFILSFPLRVGVWFCPHRCRLRTFVRELVTAPKLRIGPHRVAVVLTTRVTGDLRLLRILAIDPARPRVAQQNREIGGAGWHLGRGEFLSKRRGVVQRGIASRPRRRDAQRARLAHSRALTVGRHDTGAQSKARLRFREGAPGVPWCYHTPLDQYGTPACWYSLRSTPLLGTRSSAYPKRPSAV
jgi:hypothetical protein